MKAVSAPTLLNTLLLITLLAASPTWAQPIFSLERQSPSLMNVLSPADIFVDDTDAGGPPDVALPAAALGLDPEANVTGLSSGNDNAGFTWTQLIPLIPFENPMHSQRIFYFFSVDEDAVDQVPPGPVTIPFRDPRLGPVVSSSSNFAAQFAGGSQAGDVFRNSGSDFSRTNDLAIDAGELDLRDGDDLDALSDLGFFGGALDAKDEDGNDEPDGVLDDSVTVFFSVDATSADAGGNLLDAATVYQVTGNGVTHPTPQTFAAPGEIGLDGGDDIDALCIFQDLVVYSLRAGSPSLPLMVPGDINMVPITQGGVVLAQVGGGILAGLPAGYFGLQDTDELNAFHCVDPVPSDVTTCATQATMVQEEAVVPKPALLELNVGKTGRVLATLRTSARGNSDNGVAAYKVVAEIADPTVARIVDSSVDNCGPAGPGPDCFHCGPTGTIGPCADDSGWIGAANLEPPLTGRDICLGDYGVEGVSGGMTRLKLTGFVFDAEGVQLETVSQDTLIIVPGEKPEDPKGGGDG